MLPSSSGSAASRRSANSSLVVGGTPRAVRARRREVEGRSLEPLAKMEKASLISASVAALMLFSFAMADWRGAFAFGGVVVEGAGARRLGGFNYHRLRSAMAGASKYLR